MYFSSGALTNVLAFLNYSKGYQYGPVNMEAKIFGINTFLFLNALHS